MELELFSGQVTCKYDKKWTGEIQFSEKRKWFNPKTHCRFLHNENNRYDEDDGDSESDGADSDGSQPDPESESASSENEIEKNQGSGEEPAPRWRSWNTDYPEFKFQDPRPLALFVRDPIDYFKDYFSEDFIADIVHQSNLYIRQKNPNCQTILQDVDIYTFLGATFYMSLFGMTNSRRYWSEKSRIALIADVVSQKHFEFIKSSIHFVDNSAINPMDKVPTFFEKQLSNDNCTITAVKWYDNKLVFLASSYKSWSNTINVKRWDFATQKEIDVSAPALVPEYNSFMGQVDNIGRLLAAFRR